MKTETQFKSGRQFIARLLPGEDLIKTLKEFCVKNQIKAGYIPMMLGALESAELSHVGLNSKTDKFVKKYEGPLEYTAQGTIALKNNEPDFHIHMVVGGDNHKLAATGHFLSGKITLLTEVVIIEIVDIEMVKEFDTDIFSNPLLFFKEKEN